MAPYSHSRNLCSECGLRSTLKGWCGMDGRRFSSAAALAVCLTLIAVAVSAQGERRVATLDDLLSEMRGLRADLAQTGSASMRMQLLTARLTLQEQRIAVLSHQRADLLARLAAAERERVEVETRVKGLQDSRQEASPQMREESESALRRKQRGFRSVFRLNNNCVYRRRISPD